MTETNDGLPVGWVEATIGDVSGRATTCRPDREPDAEIVYIDISSIDNSRNEITEPKRYLGSDAPSRARQVVQEDDVLLSTVRVYLRNMAIVPHAHDGDVASTGFAVIRPRIEPRYLFYYVMTDGFVETLSECQRGSNYPAVRDIDVFLQRIPLPPLAEQRRIVVAVEGLLARTAAVTERLGGVPKTLRRFRQSVLAAACDGRLTADWRAANPDAEPAQALLDRIDTERRERLGRKYREPATDTAELADLPDGWALTSVEAIAIVGTGATPLRKRSDYFEGGTIPWVTSGAVNTPLIMKADECITPLAIRETNAKVFPVGTLLVAMYGEGQTRGRVAELGIEAATNQALAALVFDSAGVNVKPFVKLAFLNGYGELRRLAAGGVQPNLSLGIIRATPVLLPPAEEQAEIVRRAEALLALADKVEARVAIAQRRAERTAQAVLAKAFRGDLVPSEASLAAAEGRAFESGADLLARLRETPAAALKRRGRPPKAAPLFG